MRAIFGRDRAFAWRLTVTHCLGMTAEDTAIQGKSLVAITIKAEVRIKSVIHIFCVIELKALNIC